MKYPVLESLRLLSNLMHDLLTLYITVLLSIHYMFMFKCFILGVVFGIVVVRALSFENVNISNFGT